MILVLYQKEKKKRKKCMSDFIVNIKKENLGKEH